MCLPDRFAALARPAPFHDRVLETLPSLIEAMKLANTGVFPQRRMSAFGTKRTSVELRTAGGTVARK
jgi:hypothetical protein